MVQQGRSLLILDLDETLIQATDQPSPGKEPHFRVFHYAVWKRPYLDHFLATVAAWFDLAVWTASSTAYATAIIPHLFHETEHLRFVWTRERCTWRAHTEYNYYYWLKNLNKVKRRLGYQLERVLIIDDSPEKVERHYGNLITVTPFEGDMRDTELRDLLPYLDWVRTIENVRTIEKRHWRQFRRA